MVRLALEASVTCCLPPDRCHTSQESIVPNASSPRGCALAGAGDVVEQPAELGPREISIEHQPGLALNHVGVAGLAQRIAHRGGATVLPDDGVGDGPAGLALPQHGRFTLVGDADRGKVGRRDAGLRDRLGEHAELRRPDLGRIVLHPARLRKVLLELLLRDGANGAGVIEDNGAGTGRSLIQGEHERHGDVLVVGCGVAA